MQLDAAGARVPLGESSERTGSLILNLLQRQSANRRPRGVTTPETARSIQLHYVLLQVAKTSADFLLFTLSLLGVLAQFRANSF
ncbi:hypothetical protein D9M68_781310 [compost metagenome]